MLKKVKDFVVYTEIELLKTKHDVTELDITTPLISF